MKWRPQDLRGRMFRQPWRTESEDFYSSLFMTTIYYYEEHFNTVQFHVIKIIMYTIKRRKKVIFRPAVLTQVEIRNIVFTRRLFKNR